MSQKCYARTPGARPTGLVGLLAAVTLACTGCGSTSPAKPAKPAIPAGRPPATATQPLALAPAHQYRPRPSSAQGTSTTATKPASVASAPCPAGEKRTATGLCYSPAAQTKLVRKLGPCLAGQVVADNGACQPLISRGASNRPSLPARCRRPNRAGCVPRGSLQGGTVPRGPGFDPIFH